MLAAKSLLSLESRRSLVVWLTDIAETAATAEVIECTAAIASRHLVLFGSMAQTELRSLIAATAPARGDGVGIDSGRAVHSLGKPIS